MFWTPKVPENISEYIKQCAAEFNNKEFNDKDGSSSEIKIKNLGLINIFYPRAVKKVLSAKNYKELCETWALNTELAAIITYRVRLLEKYKDLAQKVKRLPRRADGDETMQKVMKILKAINDMYVKCKKLKQSIINGLDKCLKRINNGDKSIDNTSIMINSVNTVFRLYEDTLKYTRNLAKKCSMELFGTLYQVNKEEVSARLKSAEKRLMHPFKIVNPTEGSDWYDNIEAYLKKSEDFMDALEKIINPSVDKTCGDKQPTDIQSFETLIKIGQFDISKKLKSKVQQGSEVTKMSEADKALQSVKNTIGSIKEGLDSINGDTRFQGMARNILVLGAAEEIYKSIYKVFDAINVTVQNLLRTKELTADTISMVFYAISVLFASLAVIGTFTGVALFAALPLVKVLTSILSVGSTAVTIGYKYWYNMGAPAWVSNIVSKVKNVIYQR